MASLHFFLTLEQCYLSMDSASLSWSWRNGRRYIEQEKITEKERYTHLNAEFQRIARRDKKAFLIRECKEIEENNRMGRTRDLFKKIRDIKGTFHANMGSIKDRNGMDLTEAQDIKRKWQKYTEELYKTDLHDQDNHDGMITQPRARHPGMWSQVGLRKHQYKQS